MTSYKPALSVARPARVRRQASSAAPAHAEHPLLRLQRRAGNAAVARLVEQSSTINREGPEEEEMALTKRDPALQRQEMPEEEELAQTKHDPNLQRQEMPEEEELAQTAHDDDLQQGAVGLEGGPVGDEAASQVESLRGTGSTVNDGIRSSMESAFGVDLGGVRVHQDAASDSLARNMTARAFTTGSDVFLRGDVSASDPHLMAHELTHVVQQAGGAAAAPAGQRLTVGAANDPLESEADRVADAVVSGNVPEASEA